MHLRAFSNQCLAFFLPRTRDAIQRVRWHPRAPQLHSKDRGPPPTGPFVYLVGHLGLPLDSFSQPCASSPPATLSFTSHVAIARCVGPPRLRRETKRNESNFTTNVPPGSHQRIFSGSAGRVRVRLPDERRREEFLLGCVGRRRYYRRTDPKTWSTCVGVAEAHDVGSEERGKGQVRSRSGTVRCLCHARTGEAPLMHPRTMPSFPLGPRIKC